MIQESDLIVYPYEELRDKAALYISKQRLVFEYPRDGYGVYNEGHILNIKNGYLGEFAFLEFVISKFKSEFGNDKDFWDKVKKKYIFSYNPVVGNYDKGFEFLINEKSVDIKMYGTKNVSREQIFNGLEKGGRPLNLLIDVEQGAKADVYVQTFILDNSDICLAGYYVGVPPVETWMPKPAHCCPITDLEPMNNFFYKVC